MVSSKYVQDTIIFFDNIDFWPKIFQILYPSLENPTTHIAHTSLKTAYIILNPPDGSVLSFTEISSDLCKDVWSTC